MNGGRRWRRSRGGGYGVWVCGWLEGFWGEARGVGEGVSGEGIEIIKGEGRHENINSGKRWQAVTLYVLGMVFGYSDFV